jgi:hypothetical protein
MASITSSVNRLDGIEESRPRDRIGRPGKNHRIGKADGRAPVFKQPRNMSCRRGKVIANTSHH